MALLADEGLQIRVDIGDGPGAARCHRVMLGRVDVADRHEEGGGGGLLRSAGNESHGHESTGIDVPALENLRSAHGRG